MEQIILTIHILAAIALIGFILIQQGKGAEAGASFGGGAGASQTFFGSQGSGSFLTRATAILVTIFFLTSLGMAFLASHQSRSKSIDELLNKIQPATSTEMSQKPEKAQDIPEVPAAAE